MRRKAREKAEEAYDAGWNLRPADGPPPEMLELLRKICSESRSVQCATLAEARGDNALAIRYLVGLRMRPRAPVPFLQLEERLALQMTSDMTGGRKVEVTELDSDVAASMADGAANPYVVFASQSL